jgi:phosphatidylglycerol phospholipase C
MYARQFLKIPNVSFNMFQKVLVGPLGAKLLRDARADDRAVFVWTVNEEEWMEWSIRKAVDGVITDDPALFLDVCKRYEDGLDGGASGAAVAPRRDRLGTMVTKRRTISLRRKVWMYLDVLGVHILTTFLTGLLFLTGRFGKVTPKVKNRKA